MGLCVVNGAHLPLLPITCTFRALRTFLPLIVSLSLYLPPFLIKSATNIKKNNYDAGLDRMFSRLAFSFFLARSVLTLFCDKFCTAFCNKTALLLNFEMICNACIRFSIASLQLVQAYNSLFFTCVLGAC